MANKITTVYYEQGKKPVVIVRDETEEEALKREEDKTLNKQREVDMEANSEPLYCDGCGGLMGYTYANDLNGSRFYCLICH